MRSSEGRIGGILVVMKDDRIKLLLVRVTLPVTVFVVGLILVILGGEIVRGAGIFLIGSAVLGALANAYMRLGLQSNADREREERERFVGIASDGRKWVIFELAAGQLVEVKRTELDPDKPEIFLA